MYKFLIPLILFSSLHAADILSPEALVESELAYLNQLIEAAEWSHGQLVKLRGQIIEYQSLQKQFQTNPQDNELLFQLIRSAYTILESIKALHLESAFEPEFLSELSVLAKPAMKSGIPKP